jgi:DNA-binding transcriptional ArsR family regulator
MMLDLGEDPELSGEELTARILALNVPAESKVAVLELYHQGGECLAEAMGLVRQVTGCLEAALPRLELCCAPFLRQVAEKGPEAVLAQTSSLNSDPHRSDVIRPFLFGMDTLLALTPAGPGPVQVFCGILRRELQESLASAKGPEVEVFEAIRLLADQTRFDILCYLRDHDAYGQELAARFSLSRNTIHHHMTKLLSAHLVKCTVDGNRVYYRVDEDSICRLIERQQELLLPGKGTP